MEQHGGLMSLHVDEFRLMFEAALPGRSIVYYVGYLPYARTLMPRVEATASYAMVLQRRGFARLYQRRVADEWYEYIAVKRK